MVNYNEALKRPFSDYRKLLLGIILSIVPIINLASAGYTLKCASSVMSKKKNRYVLPKWENYGQLWINGLLMAVISVLYFLPAIIIALILVGFTSSSLASLENITFESYGFAAIVFFLLIFLAFYVLPAAFAAFAEKERFKEAFKYQKIVRKAFTKKYFAAWLSFLVVLVVVFLVLSWIPIVGPGIASFIASIIGYTIIGEAYYEIN